MIVDAISDLHGFYPQLEGGDLLIVAGDLTKTDAISEYTDFLGWVNKQNYKKKIFIAGNHDNKLVGPWLGGTKGPFREGKAFYDFDYLCDSGTEFQGLKIWGSPWTKTFEGMNPLCKAFTCDSEEELAKKWKLIPNDVDILITHSPAYGMRDFRPYTLEEKKANYSDGWGSKSLYKRICEMDDGKKRLLICGHIHEGYGRIDLSNMEHDKCTWRIMNVSYVNEHYKPVNKAVRIML